MDKRREGVVGISSTTSEETKKKKERVYLDDLGAVDVPQLGQAVADPFGVSSPLQQVQHVP